MSKTTPPDGDEGQRGETPARAESSDDGETATAGRVEEMDLLVVGTFGGGGVNQYVDQQVARLEDRLSVSTHAMGMPPSGSGVLWALRGLVLGLVAMLRYPFRTRPDVVHVHTSHQFSFYRSAFYVLYSKYVWGVPVVVHIHGSAFDEFVESASSPLATLQRHVLGAADEVVVLSAYWQDILAERVPEERITVLPNAVDPSEYEPTYGPDPHRIVFVSNLIERKGVTTLVDALDQLLSETDTDVEVHIAGSGPLADRVERLAADNDAVTYHGYVSESRKRDLLCSGSVFVLPTHAEGLPIALLEAMAAGNAIVSTPVGSIPELVDGGAGRLVQPADVDELAVTLESLLEDSQGLAAMGRTNRQRIEETYSWTEIIERLLDIYTDHVEWAPASADGDRS